MIPNRFLQDLLNTEELKMAIEAGDLLATLHDVTRRYHLSDGDPEVLEDALKDLSLITHLQCNKIAHYNCNRRECRYHSQCCEHRARLRVAAKSRYYDDLKRRNIEAGTHDAIKIELGSFLEYFPPPK